MQPPRRCISSCGHLAMPADSSYAAYLRDLPQDWQTAPISEVAKVVGGGTPSRDVAQFWRGAIPWATPGEVSAEASAYLSETRECISAAGLAGSGATLLPAGSLMITTRATLGARVINAVPMTTNQGFKSLVFENPSDAPFYYYLTDKLKAELQRRASGTTFLEVSGAEVGQIEVPVPPVGERALIAQVLDTLDTTIRQTEAIIEKLKQVKQGLLHDMLTRGIDANGELRPPQSHVPHLYKDSPLGRIPREWAVEEMRARLSRVTYGFTNPMPTTAEGPWMLTAADIGDGEVVYERARHTTPRAFSSLSDKSRPKAGDLLITKDGTLGRVAVLGDGNVCINQSIAAMSPRRDESLTFLSFYLRSPVGQDRLLADSGGSTIKHLYITKLATMVVPWPGRDESSEIASRLAAIEARLKCEMAFGTKLAAQKSGLMDDLLTGRVRVTPLLA